MCKEQVNKKYKDRLFRQVFGTKESLLELYNAISGTSFDDPEELEITTLHNVIYMNFKNDLSFLILEVLNLYEHQSTFNPNMPIRGLLYFAPLYRKFIKKHGLNLYSSRPVKLPVPRYVVFYNGLTDASDRTELHLTDLFVEQTGAEPCMELTAVMLNINWGHNRDLMEKCRKLKEYSLFIEEIRNRINRGIPLEDAVDRAIDFCIAKNILAEFLAFHKAEVKNVILEEYNQEEHMKSEREEWREIGREEGLAEGLEAGKAAGKAEYILELLCELGDVPAKLRQKIMAQQDLSVLKKWFRLAVKAQTIEEFEKQM